MKSSADTIISRITFIWFFFSPFASYSKTNKEFIMLKDSLVPANEGIKKNIEEAIFRKDGLKEYFINLKKEEEFSSQLSIIEDEYDLRQDDARAFVKLFRAMKLKKTFYDKKNKIRLLNDLAKSSLRLKLYPLAMECYFRSQSLTHEHTEYNSIRMDITKENGVEEIFFNPIDTSAIKNSDVNPESEPVSVSDILESFDDGKDADAYALIVHVKQPLPANRKAFTGIDNVGHMFITLIKYNRDNTSTTRSFGFYPDKTNTFSATPLHPTAKPVFKDDAIHAWDEAVGKFISKKRFEKILKLLARYQQKKYNLNQNNCTDFGLNIASIVGISISDAKGKWPFGKGNNPANAGQSILERKFIDTDTGNKDGLFICSSKNLENLIVPLQNH